MRQKEEDVSLEEEELYEMIAREQALAHLETAHGLRQMRFRLMIWAQETCE